MSTLMFRISAPLQAWGVEPRFDKWIRTGTEPSKSGIIGMIASAMGIDRNDDEELHKLTEGLRFGVRVDREGKICTDYHAVRVVQDEDCNYEDVFSNAIYVRGKRLPDTKIDKYDYKKYYLMDAAFTIGLESEDEELLRSVLEALHHPKRFLFLGRKSCPLTEEIDGEITKKTLYQALSEDLPEPDGRRHTYRIVLDTVWGSETTAINDMPVSFSSKKKEWMPRPVEERIIKVFPKTELHDPFACL